jgi:hypothetical protein
VQLRPKRGREVAKYGETTRTKLDHMVRQQGFSIIRLDQVDMARLWELVQAAEGVDTVVNPIHARQRLRRAVEALREPDNG